MTHALGDQREVVADKLLAVAADQRFLLASRRHARCPQNSMALRHAGVGLHAIRDAAKWNCATAACADSEARIQGATAGRERRGAAAT